MLNFFNIIKINNIFEKKIVVILFVSSEYRKIRLPYISTVWDMQHETHQIFKSVLYASIFINELLIIILLKL